MNPSFWTLIAIGLAWGVAWLLRGPEPWRSRTRSAATVLFIVIVPWLGFLPDPDSSNPPPFPFYGDFTNHYGIFFRQIPNVFLFFVPSLLAIHWCEKRQFHEIKRKKIEDVLLEDLNAIFFAFDCRRRSTVFLPCGGWRILFQLLSSCLSGNLVAHMKKGLVGFYFHEIWSIILSPKRKYLRIFARSGQMGNKSSTFFLVPTADSQVDGIVPYVWLMEKQHFAFFPSVADFSSPPFPKRLSDIPSKPLKRKMKRYLKDGKFRAFRDNDPDLRKIWAIHWHASNVWATPIQRDDSPNPIGILVMECDSGENVFENNQELARKLQDTPKKIYHWLTLEG